MGNFYPGGAMLLTCQINQFIGLHNISGLALMLQFRVKEMLFG